MIIFFTLHTSTDMGQTQVFTHLYLMNIDLNMIHLQVFCFKPNMQQQVNF